ncbi:MAG: class I SAM-dependent methyltransferase [Mesorhizobium sp.]|uniref:class I SAM-dependent methyltransferase n=1 Tax=unclassified Mesorhizobium TaxID=325217 RepID=UPI000F74D926|nr:MULTISPECIES: class I SAM-dependent methyltransferase [unclassified Mesorhizobium]AZO70164.1 methyltransferase domain-containing protein [Mesorhizobium sp. M1D.F.Ca.ET.043.01.1.1]RWA92555.1 MAG: methyltransferase domain-containing protein [Mesorhizobium sp.]RWE06056.1 MAG: methyltransferase domain-containing protein [Mesorhizobium sp.]TJW72073.1 MAG: class I SAM-dependent methyltransferase [Mesorhizobium sp.]
MTEHWNAIRKHWQLLGSPLRPPAQVVEAYERELELSQSHVVMLGVTPELAGLGATMTAVDESADMIAGIWPGDTDTRQAVRGDWFELPFPGASIDALIGDGCLSVIGGTEARRALFSAVGRVLKADGRAGIRLYASPGTPDDAKDVRALALSGGVSTFHELKWRVAMTATGDAPDHIIPVSRILEQFEALFPDRAELSARTGWELPVIGTIDVYRNSPAIYSFAPVNALAEEAEAYFGDVGIASTGTYGLAERCPLLVLRSPRRRE